MKKAIAILMTLFIIFGQASPVGATSASDIEKQIEENNEKINDLEKEKQGVEASKKTVQEELNELKDKITAKRQEIDVVQQGIDKISSEIASYQQEIDRIKANIGSLTKDIEEKEQSIREKEEQRTILEERLSLRLRSLYKTNYFEGFFSLILSSSSLGDLISKITAITKIVEIDNSLMQELETIKNSLEAQKEELSQEIQSLEAQNEKLYVERDSFQIALRAQEEKKKELNTAMEEIKELEAAAISKYNEFRNTESSISDEIENLDNINEELQKELDKLAEDLNKGNSGESTEEGFIRPVPGRITSEFGSRIHPIYGYEKFHYGIDIANSTGTPIKASKSGTVSYSGWMSGYGNVVILNHGNKEQTVYAHADTLKVSKGQKVFQGQVIATMGSTGNSTGPHLHFEIRIDGVKTNPRNYIEF